MAGERVNTYAQDDSDILALQLTTDKTFKGYHQLTLTNMTATTVPAIAAGSAIECNGALYKFDSEEAISTTDPVTSATVADGTVYVCIVPGTTTCTAAFTATAPTWSDSKQGWYGTGGQANYRYIQYCMNKASTAYTGKTLMLRNSIDTFYYAADATERTTTSASQVDESHLSITVPIKKGSIYEVTLIYEAKRSGSLYNIYFGPTDISKIIFFNNLTGNGDGVWNHASSNIYNKGTTTSYLQYAHVIRFMALDTASLEYKMSWSTISTTGYLKNRKMYIREIMGSIL